MNKVNSKCQIKWKFNDSVSISPDVKERFKERFGNRINVAGEVVVMSDLYRDQKRNFEDCVEKLESMLRSVLHPPRPRKKTKPSYSSRLKAKQSKKTHSLKKGLRKKIV